MKKIIITSIFLALLLSLGNTARAVTTRVFYEDTPSQDPLWVPPLVDELGVNPAGAMLFPPNESILSSDTITEYRPCLQNEDYPQIPNVLVKIVNLTGIAWPDVWYVADPETTLANDDGLINKMLAFKIDSVGLNTPLVNESIAFNGIFDIGETWEFVIQDYQNRLGLAPSAFSSVGVPSGGDLASSGSIIAIPAPGAILLGGLGAGLVGWLRRRRAI